MADSSITAESLGVERVHGVEDLSAHKATVEYVADAPWPADHAAKVAAMRATLKSDLLNVPERDAAYWCSDHALRRVLVARQSDQAAAERMWRHIMAFRAERKCWTLLDGPAVFREPEVLRRFFPWGFAGTDKDGFPLLVERVGNIDLIGIGGATRGADGEYATFLNWVCWYHEVQELLMTNCGKALGGRDRHKMTVVVDLGGLSLRHCSTATLSVLKRRTRLEEDHYPEVVRRVILINTPSMFASVWGIIKRFMDPGTSGKLQIVGADYLLVLRSFIDDAFIPKYLGGGLVDDTGDVQCRSIICGGGVVPLAYLHEPVSGDGRGAGEEVPIHAGKCSDVLLHVPGQATVRWSWATAENDIGFSVKAMLAASEPAATSTAPLIAVSKSVCGAHALAQGFDAEGAANPFQVPALQATAPGKEDVALPGAAAGGAPLESCVVVRASSGSGSWTAPVGESCIVRLRWDNSYSWMHGKTVARRVDVILAGDAATDAAERSNLPPPRGAPGSIFRPRDVEDERARGRAAHREAIVRDAGRRKAS
jgi:hypothetical protein